ncbi:thioredoxin H2 [Momordica charantia]|uniref:Thioredoxin H2 n=1 Tax=Momordica charantia TaxID=3673 RepID=A0A6J1DTQ2_MOMCH|nr:thioredoxin H2 [Momordica charantia]
MGAFLSKIGAFLSSLYGPPAASDDAASSEPSSVLSFHSSARWQLHFNSAQDSSKLMVIDFSATWCGPCRLMEPSFNAMANKYTDVEFVKIDVDELSDVAQDFGVQAMPTFVLLRRGKVVDTVVGARKEELEKKIQRHRS